VLQVNGTGGFVLGDFITINPGGANAEGAQIAGFGSIDLFNPLRFNHAAGEPIVLAGQRRCLTFNQKLHLIHGIARHFGARAGSPKYEAAYDVNHDGVINSRDIKLVVHTPTCKHHHDDDDDD
jgi:hypothetical protein